MTYDTIIQTTTDMEYQGRVKGFLQMTLSVVGLLVYGLVSLAATEVSARVIFAGAGAIILLGYCLTQLLQHWNGWQTPSSVKIYRRDQ